MSLAMLAGHLREAKEAILERWEEAVRRDPARVPSAQRLAEPQLRDHLPLLLEDIAGTLEQEPAASVEPDAWEHGRQRWGHGYRIIEVLRELSVLRSLLVDVVHECPELTRDERTLGLRRILDVIDRSAQASAAQFHAEAIAERQRLETELAAVNEQKDRFLAMLSHELRSPLGPILNAVQLLQRSRPPAARVQRASEIIERQTLHQARLIDDLLDVSRIARGKIELRREKYDLKEAVANAVETCRPALAAKEQELRVSLSDEPLPVDADPVRVEQVLTNLLANASRYTGPKGAITLSAAPEGGRAVVRVRDTGIGIAPEMLPRVFDLFTQADASLDRSQGGLGIGLALVKSLVELHGGEVEAQSAGLGQGSQFVVYLPLREAVVTESPLADVPAAPAAGQRVALVEDNADAREVMAELLELLGHQVFTAADGPAALHLAREEQPEVYIVDIGLPGMDGYQVAQTLRQMPGGEGAFLIALTGYGSAEEKEQSRAAGFDAHLTKPADIDELQWLLQQASRPPPRRGGAGREPSEAGRRARRQAPGRRANRRRTRASRWRTVCQERRRSHQCSLHPAGPAPASP